MPSRAHALWQMWADGDFVPAATVSVYEPGTTTLISDTIYANDDPDVSVLPNPFTSDASGFASFFLEDARRVDLHFAKSGFTSQTIPSVDVTFPANRFTFRGAYSAVTAYEPDDVVTYNGATWINLTAATGTTPTEGATWSKMAAAGDVNSTLIDAKGDLIVGTADNTVGRLAVGPERTIPVSRAAATGGIAWEGSPGPFHGARVSCSTSPSKTFTTGTLLPVDVWNVEEYDTDSYWTAGTPQRFTVPSAGVYRVSATIAWNNNATGSRRLFIYKNGVTQVASFAQDGSTQNAAYSMNVPLLLAASDYIELQANQTSGGNLDAFFASGGIAFFAIEYLGTV